MFEMLPYGANIVINSTASTISSKFSIGRPDYVTSMNDISTITFSYDNSNNNGDLVGIDTNLILSNWNKTDKTFTLSNSNIIGTSVKPYIKLLCNDVKVPVNFITLNPSPGEYYLNRWYSESVSNNENKINCYGYAGNNYVAVVKEFNISWSTSSEQKFFLGKDTSGGGPYQEWYNAFAYYNYYDNNNNIQSGETRLWNSQGEAPYSYNITIPKLNGELSTLKSKYKFNNQIIEVNESRKYVNYFAIGYLLQITDGYSISKSDTKNYISNGIHKVYDKRGWLKEKNFSKTYLENNLGIPKKYTDLSITWNSDFFYKTKIHNDCNDDESYYISPSTSIIKTEWDFEFDSETCSNLENDYNCGGGGSNPCGGGYTPWTGTWNNTDYSLWESPGSSLAKCKPKSNSVTVIGESGSYYTCEVETYDVGTYTGYILMVGVSGNNPNNGGNSGDNSGGGGDDGCSDPCSSWNYYSDYWCTAYTCTGFGCGSFDESECQPFTCSPFNSM